MLSVPIIYRSIQNEEELRSLWEFDFTAYGEAGLSWDIFLSWWKAFPEGIHGVFSGDIIIGAIGMWPLRSSSYNLMSSGKMSEKDISPADFNLDSDLKRHWYISGIVLREEWRRTGPIGALIFTAVERLGVLSNLDRVDLCAIASTKEGMRMLDRFGFSSRSIKTSDGHPIYISSDLVLDLALGEKSVEATSPNFRYKTSLRQGFSSNFDLDDLRSDI